MYTLYSNVFDTHRGVETERSERHTRLTTRGPRSKLELKSRPQGAGMQRLRYVGIGTYLRLATES